jgi:hypothetical protein
MPRQRPAVSATAGLNVMNGTWQAKTRYENRYWPTLTVTGAVLVLTPSETV